MSTPFAGGAPAVGAAASSHNDGGNNYGPVIAMLVFIALITAGSVAVGRYCVVGRDAFRRGSYELGGYVVRSCRSCIGSCCIDDDADAASTPPAKKEEEAAASDPQPEVPEEIEMLEASQPSAEEEEEGSQGGGADP